MQQQYHHLSNTGKAFMDLAQQVGLAAVGCWGSLLKAIKHKDTTTSSQ